VLAFRIEESTGLSDAKAAREVLISEACDRLFELDKDKPTPLPGEFNRT
jgi:hypothetical protein